MKKLLALCCLAFLLIGCEKKFPTEVSFKDVTFNFTINYPGDADPAKTGWEAGDKAFVFFGATNAYFISLVYDGAAWNASVIDPFGVGRMSTSSRYAMALYRPLITDDSFDVSSVAWCIPDNDYCYYLASDPVACSWERLSGGKMELSATLDLHCPKQECVQFFIEDDAAGAEYTLRSDNFQNLWTQVIYLSDLTVDFRGFQGHEMKGFPCEYGGKRGYLFCGLFSPVQGGAYLILTDRKTGKRWDYNLYDNSVLNSREVMHLPSPGGEPGWQEVSADKPIAMRVGGKDLGTWQVCDYGSDAPEKAGTVVSFSEAVALGAPTRAEIETLFNGCKRYFYRVGGQEGVLLRSDTGFLFFPTDMTYWTSSPGEIPGFSLYYYFYYDSDMPMYDIEPETKLRVRGIVR